MRAIQRAVTRVERPRRPAGRVEKGCSGRVFAERACALALLLSGTLLTAQGADSAAAFKSHAAQLPARVNAAQRLLSDRGSLLGRRLARPAVSAPSIELTAAPAANSPTWTALGPAAVLTPHYGLVSGRITSVAVDPSDSTGNHVYVGTTGGGVWVASNAAASPAQISFTPLTDNLSALGGIASASISIGALTVQPGGTKVVLAGTGDPNDVFDSYYGAGILRSTDGGGTWSLITRTTDLESGLGIQNYGFLGEAVSGFAWSTMNPQIVVAAVSQAYEGVLVDAVALSASYQGLYYSADSGATWHLATIRDGSTDVQGPASRFAQPDGNAATAVIWNPVRKLFIAAVRYHGYYQSADGVVWTRMENQPGQGLSASNCPSNAGSTGSLACPIFRGTLAVNPQTGDTFAWTVDVNQQDQGIWQDQCALANGACTNAAISFDTQWDTTALQTNTSSGTATIADGDYNLSLAAVPQQQTTMVLAGAHDLWQTSCPLSQGCSWRNTTNATTCMSAQVGLFQHAVAWPDVAWWYADPTQRSALTEEIFIGNDSGLWRSLDAIGEDGAPCNPIDSTHFQNMNGSLGSLAEVESLPQQMNSPYSLLAGMGGNGTAGLKSGAAAANWPQILGGYGGPVAIDPSNENNWYVNEQAGVAIYRCATSSPCTPADFGAHPLVTNSDVAGDGNTMAVPAQFLVDPLDPAQLLVATCRLWRGPVSGGWSAAHAISPILDSPASTGPCQGNALIRSIAAMPISPTREVLYAGIYGAGTWGARIAGHLFKATLDTTAGTMPSWTDVTWSPVRNDAHPFNQYNFDISSIAIDPHDPSGNTIYVTVEGMAQATQPVQTVYRSTDGGATWNSIAANLPNSPANAIAVDPQNANVVYVATDAGVSFTTQASTCANAPAKCWTAFGSGLPQSPVVGLSATSPASGYAALIAATYGRGLWQTPLWTAQASLSAASVSPATLSFPGQVYGTSSSAQTITLSNTGSGPLQPTAIVLNGNDGDFTVTGCVGQTVPAGGNCLLSITFNPQAAGARTAQMIVYANVYGGQLAADLNGTGLPGGSVTLAPSSADFGSTKVGTSALLSFTATNAGSAAVSITSLVVTQPFYVVANACGTTALDANHACQIQVKFTPLQPGAAAGLLTLTDGAGTQTVQLSGTGAAPPTDILNPLSVNFPATASAQVSTVNQVTISNKGDLPLHITSIEASTGFQQTSDCLAGVAAHSDCKVSVQFAPTQPGLMTGTLKITDELGVETVSLGGTGLQPGAFSVVPANLNFAQQQPGVVSSPLSVAITNNGGMDLANIGLQITGPGAANYAIVAKTCGAALTSGASCSAQIVFTPPDTGTIAATLVVTSSTTGVTAAQVQLNGSGQLASGLSVTPGLLPFTSATGVGQLSAAQPVTITNASSYSISSIALAATGPFSLAQNACVGTLGPGATCTAAVAFQPNAAGVLGGTLTVSSTVVTAPATVALSGTGFDFTVSPSGPATATVSSGQQADYKLLIAPNGAAGSFSFQCGSLPANALCLFSPATEQLGIGVQGNVEVQIYTGSATVSRAETPSSNSHWPMYCVVLFAPLAFWRTRRTWLLVMMSVLLASGASSCTGSSGGGSSTSGGQSSGLKTPAGTYSIPVTITSTGLSRSVTLTLTVD